MKMACSKSSAKIPLFTWSPSAVQEPYPSWKLINPSWYFHVTTFLFKKWKAKHYLFEMYVVSCVNNINMQLIKDLKDTKKLCRVSGHGKQHLGENWQDKTLIIKPTNVNWAYGCPTGNSRAYCSTYSTDGRPVIAHNHIS